MNRMWSNKNGIDRSHASNNLTADEYFHLCKYDTTQTYPSTPPRSTSYLSSSSFSSPTSSLTSSPYPSFSSPSPSPSTTNSNINTPLSNNLFVNKRPVHRFIGFNAGPVRNIFIFPFLF